MASNLTRTFLNSSRIVQKNYVRTLISQQGVAQLGQTAEKFKEAVSNAKATVVSTVRCDNTANRNVDEAKIHGQNATNDLKNPTNEAVNYYGFESISNNSSSVQPSNSYHSDHIDIRSPASQTSGDYGSSPPSTTDVIKHNAMEYTQQAKAFVNQATNIVREVAHDAADSMKDTANKASQWIKDTKDNVSSDLKRSADATLNKTRDTIKSGADSIKSSADKAAGETKRTY